MTLLRLTLKNIADKWIRFLLTALAVVLGVGFVVGTFIITDGLRASFAGIAEDIASTSDLGIRVDRVLESDTATAALDPAITDQVLAVDGVDWAEGGIFTVGVQVIDAAGDSVGGDNAFRAGGSFGRGSGTFLVTEGPLAGRAPEGPDEFALNTSAAEDADLEIGQSYLVEALESKPMTLVGVFNWASPEEDGFLGGSFATFDLATAIDFLNGGQGINQISVGVETDADVAAVQAAIEATLPDGLEVIDATQVEAEQNEDFDGFLDIFANILLSFAVVTLIVSAFLIFNTFSIVVGQRVRELGLLRALGASGSQVTWSIVAESLVVGILASLTGVVVGIGIAWVLREIFATIGVAFPDGPLPVKSRTIIVALVMGIGMTVLSAVIPALKARRVAPLAAIRDDLGIGSFTPKLRPRLGLALLGLGLVVLVLAVASGSGFLGIPAALLLYFGGTRLNLLLGRFAVLAVGLLLLIVAAIADLSTTELLVNLSIGALLSFVGVNLVSPLFAKPIASLIGTKVLGVVLGLLGVGLAFGAAGGLYLAATSAADGSVGGIIGGVILALLAAGASYLCVKTCVAPWQTSGRLGTDNAGRNPRRTSSTAAALMIGLALVGTVSVIGASIKKTFNEILERSVTADWFICEGNCNTGFGGFSPTFAERAAALPEIESVIPYRFTDNAIGVIKADAVDNAELTDNDLEEKGATLTADFDKLGEHLDADFIDGDPATADPFDLLIHKDIAEDLEVAVGDQLPILFVSGQRTTLTIGGIYEDNQILGDWVVSNEAAAEYLPAGQDQFVSVVTAAGVDEDAARGALDTLAEDYPDVEVRNKDEFQDSQADQIDQLLLIINVFLALALIIALVGIANTLALSVFERTREIGLLRAVGASRDQTSTLIRWEGSIIAVFGGILGLALGIVFGIIAVIVMPDEFVNTIAIDPLQLVQYLVVAALAGVIAAYFPARRAARLNVLDAISHE